MYALARKNMVSLLLITNEISLDKIESRCIISSIIRISEQSFTTGFEISMHFGSMSGTVDLDNRTGVFPAIVR